MLPSTKSSTFLIAALCAVIPQASAHGMGACITNPWDLNPMTFWYLDDQGAPNEQPPYSVDDTVQLDVPYSFQPIYPADVNGWSAVSFGRELGSNENAMFFSDAGCSKIIRVIDSSLDADNQNTPGRKVFNLMQSSLGQSGPAKCAQLIANDCPVGVQQLMIH